MMPKILLSYISMQGTIGEKTSQVTTSPPRTHCQIFNHSTLRHLFVSANKIYISGHFEYHFINQEKYIPCINPSAKTYKILIVYFLFSRLKEDMLWKHISRKSQIDQCMGKNNGFACSLLP